MKDFLRGMLDGAVVITIVAIIALSANYYVYGSRSLVVRGFCTVAMCSANNR